MMYEILRFRGLALALLTALLLQACTTAQQVHEGSDVAKEGIELTKILPDYYDAYFESVIRADSVTLALIRRGLLPDELGPELEKSNTQLEQTGKFIDEIKDHLALLQGYFEAIGDLTDAEVGEGLGASTADLIDGMAAARKEIVKADPMNISVRKAGKPSGNFAVVRLKSKALQKELEAHGAAIEAELELQETLLSAVGESMANDYSAWVIAGLRDPLFESYESKTPALPRDWVEQRIQYLTRPEKVAITTVAKDAMIDLLMAWRELADGRPETSTMMRLRNRVDATGKLVEAIAN